MSRVRSPVYFESRQEPFQFLVSLHVSLYRDREYETWGAGGLESPTSVPNSTQFHCVSMRWTICLMLVNLTAQKASWNRGGVEPVDWRQANMDAG